MKKLVIVTTIMGTVLILIFLVARLTGMLQFYRQATASMSPSLEISEQVITTNLKEPKRNDIVVFKKILDQSEGAENAGKAATWVFRLIGLGGEKVELKNGLAYVNGRLVDDSTALKFYYSFPIDKKDAVISVLRWDINNLPEENFVVGDKSVIILLNHEQYTTAQKAATVNKLYDRNYQSDISLYQNDENKRWNVNNYGPVIIPPGNYFLLGDNRNAANDSRYIGFVNKKDIKGVVIAKY